VVVSMPPVPSLGDRREIALRDRAVENDADAADRKTEDETLNIKAGALG
jgi:hypothetical protein